jgi:chromosome segregation ATPase
VLFSVHSLVRARNVPRSDPGSLTIRPPENSAVRDQAQETIHRLKRERDEHETQIAQLEQENRRLKDALAQREVEVTKSKTLVDSHANYTRQLEKQLAAHDRSAAEMKQRHANVQKENEELRRGLGLLELCLSGCKTGQPRNDQVLIRLVEARDQELAERIQNLFSTCALQSPWRVDIDSELKLRKNPCRDARIVVTSSTDPKLAQTLMQTFNRYQLISERVETAAAEVEESIADVTITIYRGFSG